MPRRCWEHLRGLSNQADSKKDGVHYMGVSIHLAISHSVTREEWADVYEETLQLVKRFPLAERREVPVRGIPTMCLVRTKEREYQRGWTREEFARGWFADGDYERVRTAEEYFLPRDLVSKDQYDRDAPDALLESALDYLGGYDRNDSRFYRNYSLWGAKTQGEPYHMYLLAIACLIESRLGQKAYVYGDITKGQCERAVRMANEHLDRAIHAPDRCDKDRLLNRINDIPLSETEKLELFTGMYLGREDAEFGKTVREHFSEQACDEYWGRRFHLYQVTMVGFDNALADYLLWGFDLERMCLFISFQDEKGDTHYEQFIRKVMDTKLHHREKDCTDLLKTDPDDEEPYGIETLFAQLVFMGARNKKVDRYIPIDKIRLALSRAIGNLCPVDEIIDEYLQEEDAQEPIDLSGGKSDEDCEKAAKQDPSGVMNEMLKTASQVYKMQDEKYDIWRPEDLPYYEAGDSVHPNLVKALGMTFEFYRSFLGEDTYLDLMKQNPVERCKWLARKNRWVLLRDKDWERIYDDIMENSESFARYYPMMRVKAINEGLSDLPGAFAINDDLYSYALGLASDVSE